MKVIEQFIALAKSDPKTAIALAAMAVIAMALGLTFAVLRFAI